MKVKELEEMVGGLSKPSKMPGLAIGLPAWKCKLGSILAKKTGSVCNSCYALRGMYVFPAVKRAQEKRLQILMRDMFAWKRAMITLLERKYARKTGNERVFRFHDSGDLQNMEHLAAIVDIAKMLPTIKFWLPTREAKMVREYLATGKTFPDNLSVRISVQMVGQKPKEKIAGTNTSTVGAEVGYACPARNQGNNCGDCRACWNRDIENIDYPLH